MNLASRANSPVGFVKNCGNLQLLINCAPPDTKQFGTAHWSQVLSRKLECPRYRILTITLPYQKCTLGSIDRRRRHSAPFFSELPHYKQISTRNQKQRFDMIIFDFHILSRLRHGHRAGVWSANHIVNIPNVRVAESRKTLLDSHFRGSKVDALTHSIQCEGQWLLRQDGQQCREWHPWPRPDQTQV